MKNTYRLYPTLLVLTAALFSGCAGMMYADKNAQKIFTFDYNIADKSQSVLWKSGRDYFAGIFGDSRAVFKVSDETEGTMIGQGLATWSLASNVCKTSYHIRFAAKDSKARLQLEIIEGVPLGSPCSGYPWPSANGYTEIVDSFNKMALELENALKGKAAESDFKNF